MATFPASPVDLEAQRRIIAEVLRPWPRAAALADHLGVSEGCVSNWVRGTRSPDLVVLRLLCRETARLYPEHAERLHQILVRELLDLRARLVHEDLGEVGSWLQESLDVTRLHGRLAEAVERGDELEVERLAAAAHRELDEALAAARARARAVAARGGS